MPRRCRRLVCPGIPLSFLIDGALVADTVARIDGGIVLDSQSNLLAFGAILRHPDLTDMYPENIEGGRTTAAISASQLGNVLKISEDGLISFFQNGRCIWDI
jgi:DNA integrity scanning protein DisA with diadenylate cyclase activity